MKITTFLWKEKRQLEIKTSEKLMPAILSSKKGFNPLRYLFIILFLFAFIIFYRTSEIDFTLLFGREGLNNIYSFLSEMSPPRTDPEFLSLLIKPTFETLQISVMGTLLAILIGLPLSLFATSTSIFSGIAREIDKKDSFEKRIIKSIPYFLSRWILNFFRAVPEFVWALLFVRAVGLGPFPGILAIGIGYGGILGKIYAEILEGVDQKPLEALKSSGATNLNIFFYGFLPQASPLFVSYTLYRWECAIRASAILGFVGAGGIGQQIEISMRMFNYHEVATLILIVFLMVTIIDNISNWVRRIIL